MNKRVIFWALMLFSLVFTIVFPINALRQCEPGVTTPQIVLNPDGTSEYCLVSGTGLILTEKETVTYEVYLFKDQAYFESIIASSDTFSRKTPKRIVNCPAGVTAESGNLEECTTSIGELSSYLTPAEIAAKAKSAAGNQGTTISVGKVTCTYSLPQGQKVAQDGASSDKCTVNQGWDIVGGTPGILCNYPIVFEMSINKNQPKTASITKCEATQTSQGVNPSSVCGLTFTGCREGIEGILVAQVPTGPTAATTPQLKSPQEPPSPTLSTTSGAISTSSSRFQNLDWTKLFFLALIAGIIGTLIVNKRSSKRKARRIYRPLYSSNLHHFLNSNNYKKSFGSKL